MANKRFREFWPPLSGSEVRAVLKGYVWLGFLQSNRTLEHEHGREF